jgi:hypothetical protein
VYTTSGEEIKTKKGKNEKRTKRRTKDVEDLSNGTAHVLFAAAIPHTAEHTAVSFVCRMTSLLQSSTEPPHSSTANEAAMNISS